MGTVLQALNLIQFGQNVKLDCAIATHGPRDAGKITLDDTHEILGALVPFDSWDENSPKVFTSEQVIQALEQQVKKYSFLQPILTDAYTWVAREQAKEDQKNGLLVEIGTDVKTGERVTLKQDKRLGGMYVIGKTGSGKTTLLINLILQDILQGMGVCFFDPHGDAISDILARLPQNREQDVILLDPLDKAYAFGLNLYQCDNPTDIDESARTVSYVLQVFAKLFADGDLSKMPQMAQILRNSALTLIDNPGTTMAEIPLLLADEDACEKLIRNVTNPQVRLFWNRYNRMKPQEQRELTQSTLNKLDEFLSQPSILHIVGQSQSTLLFRQIMDEGKILLVKLSRQHWQLTSLVGAIIIGQLANAAYSRANIPQDKRRQFNLYADEYQRFSTPDFAELLTEVRKFAVATTIAHQFRGQLDQANRGATLNAANMVVYQVSGEDASELAKEFDHTPTRGEQIGEEAVKAPTPDAVGFLLRNGHSNPKLSTLMYYLQEAQQELGTQFVPTLPSSFELDKTNEKEIEFWNENARQREIDRLQRQYVAESDAFKRKNMEDEKATIRQGLNALNKLLHRVMEQKPANIAIPWDILEGFAPVSSLYLFFKMLYFAAGTGSTLPQKYFTEVQTLLLAANRSANRDRIVSLLNNRVGYYNIDHQIDKCIVFLNEISDACNILSKDPILVPTGKFLPKYAQRTYQDMENEIASRLANPKAFTAFCKLGGREYTLSASPFKQADEPDVVQIRREQIIAQTRANYCKKRIDIDTEIASRQDALMKPEKKERKTHQEDDEA